MTVSDSSTRYPMQSVQRYTPRLVVSFIVFLTVIGCSSGSNHEQNSTSQSPTTESAALALKISELTGWERFEVQVGIHDEGRHVIVTRIPGPPDGHMSVFFHPDGRVEEFDVP